MNGTRNALYFGCWEDAGHFLHDVHGRHIYDRPSGLPWGDNLMDGGLLKNGKVRDIPTGEVYWTCGGANELWYAFYWWDRSVDTRGACNSGFYVKGFDRNQEREAFDYACTQFPHVVNRQKFPLVLQNVREHVPEPSTPRCPECNSRVRDARGILNAGHGALPNSGNSLCKNEWHFYLAAPSRVPEVDAEREAREWLLKQGIPNFTLVFYGQSLSELLAAYARRMK